MIDTQVTAAISLNMLVSVFSVGSDYSWTYTSRYNVNQIAPTTYVFTGETETAWLSLTPHFIV
jgi:hypothetical protein